MSCNNLTLARYIELYTMANQAIQPKKKQRVRSKRRIPNGRSERKRKLGLLDANLISRETSRPSQRVFLGGESESKLFF